MAENEETDEKTENMNEEENKENGDMKMHPVIHFEMPAKNKYRMIKFYQDVFGWKTEELGEEMNNYVNVQTVETNGNGGINGGFFEKAGEEESHPSIVIHSDNLEEHKKKIEEAGGKIEGETRDIPGVGKYVSFTDTEGNRISILEPSK